MRILQVGSALRDWGGIERYLVYLIAGLRERGHEVIAAVPPGSPLDQRIDGGKIHIDLRRQFQFTRLPAYVRLFRSQKFDVVNAHYSPDFIVPAIAAKIARQPCRILTRHLVLTWSPLKVRRYTRLFTHFIGVSDAVARKLESSGVPASRVQVAKAGCPPLEATLPVDQVREQLAIRGFSVGFFGRVVEDKGLQTLVEASTQLPEETLHVFGDGPMLDSLRRKGTGLRLHGRVEDVVNPMCAMDAIVIPSLWDEAFPYSAMEAMSLGKPIVATRSGGLPELVEDGVTGFVVEKRDVGALVSALSALRDDPALASRMGAAARERHRTELTVDRFAERMEAAYTNAVSVG